MRSFAEPPPRMLWPIPDRWPHPTISPLIMGILNVTPDSFSDGGDYQEPEQAIARAGQMIAEGADIIDVGPESTRPNSGEVSAALQMDRAVPVIRALRAKFPTTVLSIDTRLAGVAQAALDAGADIINDTSALRDDPGMVRLAAASGARVVLMHRRGKPATMQRDGGPEYHDVVGEIVGFLQERVEYAVTQGVDRSRILLDPGLGFGKRIEHNLLILRNLDRFIELGLPVFVGASRKRFIGETLRCIRPEEANDPKSRLFGSLACAALATIAGVSVLRVHDVRATAETVRMCQAVWNADTSDT